MTDTFTLADPGWAPGFLRRLDLDEPSTTTGRHLRPMTGGGWLIDTPAMRALRLAEAHARDRAFGRVVRSVMRDKAWARDDR
ncbi:hypothetical protein [Rhodovulum sp. ES.010]|uniref:hypothetical protein n=1 Tax=Rhodovulum sp. ES.010 TaxID=1882821 RepID=UPI0009408CE3|nr:hypothetical protein [Rhodovulum sp. ES.010]